MGCYINPTGESKESFLEREGLEVTLVSELWIWEELQDLCRNTLPVVLVDSECSTAAAIAYCRGEYLRLAYSKDKRKKRIFLVSTEKLSKVSPYLKDYVKLGA